MKLLNRAVLLVTAAMFISPIRLYATIAMVFIPWIGLILACSSKGRITIDVQRRRPTVLLAIGIPAMAMLFLPKTGYLYHLAYFWLPFTGIILCMAFALAFIAFKGGIDRRRNEVKFIIGVYAVLLPLYATNAVLQCNARFDRSQPIYYTTTVLQKSQASGKASGHYFTLSPWLPTITEETIDVSASMYQQTAENSQLRVCHRAGWLGIPWYTVQP
ncbi:hypothetical protein [Chitinophaga nivalis]|uniref:Uncharacterized protein n=1 Tax=Chitinophaga nivalis TaxID=2991709 RepID=A0ABT3IMM4_9BACT|nr:hypothetical protein [Chitinophaga nivalis]MCW3465085.1 hypothetical protein [Chitinophaga nivalis]MCW3485223.1 hypothetical protein [Chitinophaga nivalis]